MTPETWEKARPLIERALPYWLPLYAADDIKARIKARKMQLWCAGGSIVVTEIRKYPRGKAIQSVLAAGKLAEVKALVAAAERWGAEQGCQYAVLTGRKGWARVMKDYRQVAVQLAKEI